MLLKKKQILQLSQCARIVRVAAGLDLKTEPYRRLGGLMAAPVHNVSIGELARAQEAAASQVVKDIESARLETGQPETLLKELAADLAFLLPCDAEASQFAGASLSRG